MVGRKLEVLSWGLTRQVDGFRSDGLRLCDGITQIGIIFTLLTQIEVGLTPGEEMFILE